MDDLIAFLNAREDEREADANERHTVYCAALDPCYEPPEFDNPDFSRCDCKQRWTLADIAAKRQIIEQYKNHHRAINHGGAGICTRYLADELLKALRLLALPFASHPDYRESWRPS